MKKNNNSKIVYSLLILMIILPCIGYIKQYLDNDFYFIYLHGERIMNEGFFHVDNLTMHEGFHIAVQQWLTSVIFYNIYNVFGQLGINILLIAIHMLICFILFKVYMLATDNNLFVSLSVAALVSYSLKLLLTSRPIVFTVMCCVLVIGVMTIYSKNNNVKWLLLLPLISTLQINLHASMWVFIFFPIFPFIYEMKGLSLGKMQCESINKTPILISMIVSMLAGFINPYGYENVIYVFKSVDSRNYLISEMMKSSFDTFSGIYMLFTSLIIFALLLYKGCEKVHIRSMLFFLGGILLGGYAVKCLPLYIIYMSFLLAELLKDISISDFSKKTFAITDAAILVLIVAVAVNIYDFSTMPNRYQEQYDAVDYLVENEDIKEDNKVYTSFNASAYAEYNGLRPYIDVRMELFFEKQNQKEDIWNEYLDMTNGIVYYKDFLEKYDFDYLIVEKYDLLYEILKNEEIYAPIYNSKNCIIYKNDKQAHR